VGNPDALEGFDWSLTTWEGSRREQMRRWAELPLDRIIAALEEMEDLTQAFRTPGSVRAEADKRLLRGQNPERNG
jgi:hypothetical protein